MNQAVTKKIVPGRHWLVVSVGRHAQPSADVAQGRVGKRVIQKSVLHMSEVRVLTSYLHVLLSVAYPQPPDGTALRYCGCPARTPQGESI